MRKKGFTIIEILAVIIIIGAISMIGVISINAYLANSEKDIYIANLKTFVKAAKDLYNSDRLAQEPRANEALIIPLELLELDQSAGYKSPYGTYIKESTYIIVTRENDQNTYYIVALDSGDIGINCVRENKLHRREIIIDNIDIDKIKTLDQISFFGAVLELDGVEYQYAYDRNTNDSVTTMILKELE